MTETATATRERRGGAAPERLEPLDSPFAIGDVEIANRVLLAPLAGIGNWFVRMQARRYGAGLAVSEMISSFALAHRNERTMRELLRIHPDEGRPVAIQLFGHEPAAMREAAAIVAEAGADIVDINMGCPVRKVRRTGAGASLISEPALAVELVRAAAEGSGRPVTVKVRSGLEPGDSRGLDLAERLVMDGGAAAIAFHPRSAEVHHKGEPDYALAAELVRRVDVPVILSGGLSDADRTLAAREASGADAVMIARGAIGNPWIFGELVAGTRHEPGAADVVAELEWTLDRAAEHWGPERAARNLRKLYPWYLERLGIAGREAHAFQTAPSLDEVRRLARARLSNALS